MTCRHAADDPACSSYPHRVNEARRLVEQDAERTGTSSTPDAARFEILEAQQVGAHLVLKVQYPNCARCAYEGVKVMVFLNVQATDALRWNRIDPHFRNEQPTSRTAPSPAARFPASEEGWLDALFYAQHKQ
jgi:hypothetical protein